MQLFCKCLAIFTLRIHHILPKNSPLYKTNDFFGLLTSSKLQNMALFVCGIKVWSSECHLSYKIAFESPSLVIVETLNKWMGVTSTNYFFMLLPINLCFYYTDIFWNSVGTSFNKTNALNSFTDFGRVFHPIILIIQL